MAEIDISRYKDKPVNYGSGNQEIDISKYKDKPSNQVQPPQQQAPQQQGSMLGDILKGGALGAAESVAGIGAIPARLLNAGMHYIGGRPWIEGLNPDLQEFAPKSDAGEASFTAGNFLGPLLIPGGKILAGGTKAQRIGKLVSEHEKLTQSMLAAAQREARIKAEASHNFGLSNPERLKLQGNALQQKIQEGKQFLQENPHEDLTNRLPAPSGENVLNLAESTHAGNLRRAEQALYHGENFPAAIAEENVRHFEGVRNPETGKMEGGLRQQVGAKYNKLESDLQDKNVAITHQPDVKKALEHVKAALPDVPEAVQRKALADYVQALEKTENINAADFLKNYRVMKSQARMANEAAYRHGTPLDQQEQWKAKARALSSAAEEMRNVLDAQLGGNYSERLRAIDKEYATNIAPLSKNKAYLMMKEHGQAPANYMQKISGTTPKAASLNFPLKNLMENNPYLQKLTVGQQYAHRPEALIEPNRLLERYSGLNPEIKSLRDKIMESQARIEPARQTAAQQKGEAKVIEEGFKKKQDIQAQREQVQKNIEQWPKDIEEMDRLAAELEKEKLLKETPKARKNEIDERLKELKAKKGMTRKALSLAHNSLLSTGILKFIIK